MKGRILFVVRFLLVAYLLAFGLWVTHQLSVVDRYFDAERRANENASGGSEPLHRAYDCNRNKFWNARSAALDELLTPSPLVWAKHWSKDYVLTECEDDAEAQP